MNDSRDTVLSKVREALAADGPRASAIPRCYHRSGRWRPGSAEVIDLLVDRLIDYKALVRRCGAADLADTVDQPLSSARSVVIPPGLTPAVRQACGTNGRTVVVDGDPEHLSAAALDRIDAVVTAARVAIAISGTIILDGQPDQGRRIITLVPDHHVVILRASQVVETVPEAIGLVEPTRPLTMIAGPSATSDIELERVEGVHGPRTLDVIIVE